MAYKVINIRDEMPRHPTKKWKTRRSISGITLHCLGSRNQDPKKTARYHIDDLGWPGIGYHDFIVEEQLVYHCNNYRDITYHAKAANSPTVGVVLAYPGLRDEPPSSEMLNTVEAHIAVLSLYFKLFPETIKGHREYPWMYRIIGKGVQYVKDCPGLAIDMNTFRFNVAKRLQRVLAAKNLYKGNIDGIFGKKSKAALLSFQPSVKDLKT